MKRFNIAAALLVVASSFALGQTTVSKAAFGKLPDGSAVDVYTLADKILTVRIITFGAHIISVKAPDKTGAIADVVMGFDTLDGYLADDKTYMGSVAGRYANRIGKGQFTLDGKQVQLDLNNNGNTLHGGKTGFDRENWTAKQVPGGVELTLVSKDGDRGFPGTLTAHVKYRLVGDKLAVTYTATTDKPTVVNLTQHSYFNLAGKGDILGHKLMLNANRYTAIDAGLIPTGQLPSVTGTPFDFHEPTLIGKRIQEPNDQLKLAGGYDHNWILNTPVTIHKPAAVVTDPGSGRVLRVYTSEPGIQFYSGNFLDGTARGRDGSPYNKYAGLCLETQHYPDSPNHPEWPSTTLLPGHTYHSETMFEFTVQK